MKEEDYIMRKTIQQVENFGAIDAENDKNLLENFYKAKVIDELVESQKSIVIGRKGTGKSAIYTYICDEYKDEAVKLVFKDYPWQLHDRFKNELVSERERYVNSWEFLLYIEIAKKIITNKNNIWSKVERKEIKKLKKWLVRNWGSLDFNYKENLNPKGGKTIFNFAPQIMGNGLGSIAKEVATKDNVGSSLVEYNRKLDGIISKLLKSYNKNIILAFDQLDLAYSHKDFKYIEKLIGLLLTTYNFYQKYNNVKVIVFLRSDIFMNISFQDKNKIKDNLVEFLDWNAEDESGLSLKNLISKRIKNTLELEDERFDVCWKTVFSTNKIGKNQFKWNYLIDRTFLRPRDIIKFMNLSLAQANKRLANNPEGENIINNEDINNIKDKYSTYLYEELKDEISGKYQDFEYYLEVLREIHLLTFTKEDFDEKYEKVKERYQLIETSDVVMERLYEFSIIGFYKPGGGGYGGSEYRFQYTSEYQKFNPNASKYKVHLGFKEYLELIENRGTRIK